MFNLIRKDWLLHKPACYGLLPVLVIYLGYLATQVSSPGVFITFSCIMASIFTMIAITREDKFGSEMFVCSLPVTRRQVVRAKYVVGWVAAIVMVLVGLVLYSILAGTGRLEVWSFQSTGRALVLLTLGICLGFPFALRFGWMGLIAGLVGMQVIGIVTLLLVEAFDVSFQPRDAFVAVANAFEELQATLGGPLFMAVILAFAAVISLVSCRIAVVLFEHREF